MKASRHLIRLVTLLILLITILCAVTVSAAAADFSLTATDKIYIPRNPTAQEQAAATELALYLKQITGKTYKVEKRDETKSGCIYIGNTKMASSAGITAYPNANGGGEGWAIQVKNGSLFLTGGTQRGIVYAVAHFLEDVMGVRWFSPWEEYVPSNATATVPKDYFASGEPVFDYRDIYTTESFTTLYFAHNRLNGWVSGTPASYGGTVSYSLPYHTHTFNRYFTDTDFASNPEWFALVDGVRVSDGQLCMSNDSLVQEFASRMISYIYSSYYNADRAGKPRPKFADITPNDTGGFCECSACVASTAASGPSGHLIKFVNKVAAIVKQSYPEILLSTSAYWQYLDVPLDNTVPASNVVLSLANNDVDIIHDIHHPNNAQIKNRVDAWANILDDGQMYIWDYAVHYTDYYGLVPNYFKFQRDYQYYYEKGCFGVFTELEMINSADMWDMNVWLMAKIMENPYADVYALAQDFCTNYYGAAAGMDVYNYLVLMEEAAEDYYVSVDFGDDTMAAPWLNAAEAKAGYNYFESAVAKLNADTSISDSQRTLYLNRLNVARRGLDQTIIYNYSRLIDEAARNGWVLGIDRQEVGRRLYATQTWLMNMTANRAVSGLQNVYTRSNYDRTDLFNRYKRFTPETNISQLYPDIPQQVYDDHPGLDRQHIYDYPAVAMSYDSTYVSLVSNAASYSGGSALVLDQATAYAANPNGDFSFSETVAMDGSLDEKLRLNDPFIADGQYHLYRIEDTSPYVEGRHSITLFDSTMSVYLEGMDHLCGIDTEVDIYISMKIDGDPSGTSAVFYVDRIIIVEDCEIYNIYGTKSAATCAAGVTTTGPCPVCGETVSKEDESTRLPHKLTSNYVYNSATNTYTANCSVCGEAEYKFKGKLPDDLLSALKSDGIGLEHVNEFIVADFELWSENLSIATDTNSPVGKAIKVSNDANALTVNAYTGGGTETKKYGTIAYNTLKANNNNGYKVYKVSNCELIAKNDYSYYWFFYDSWMLQSKKMMRELLPLTGNTTDVYVSVRFAGDVYYIDRVFVVDQCSNYSSSGSSYTPPTCTTNAINGSLCSKCGSGSGTEVPNTALGHLAGDYVYNANSKVYESICTRKGCGQIVSTVAAHTVTFNADGTTTTQIVRNGTTVAEPAKPEKAGHTFNGWYLNGTKYDFKKSVTSDITLVAKFTAKVTYTVTFDVDGTTTTQTVAGGIAMDEPAAPTKEGYTFDGWYLNGVKYDFSKNVTGNMTLVARFNINSYTVTFDADGTITTQTVVYGETVAEPTAPTKVNYRFTGWYLNGVKYSFDTPVTGDITLVAQFKQIVRYNVTFNLDGSYTIKSVEEGKTVTKPTDPTKDGYVFDGWYLGSTKFDFSTPITKAITLTAKWTEAITSHTVTFDVDGVTTTETVEEGMTVAAPEAPAKDGYDFRGWYLDGAEYDFATPVTGDITLVAKFTMIPTSQVTARTLITSGLLQIRLKIAYNKLEGLDVSKAQDIVLNNGGVLVWEGTDITAENAVHGSGEMKDLPIAEASTPYGGLMEYHMYLEVGSWQYGDTFTFRPYIELDGEYYYGEMKTYGVQDYVTSMMKKSTTQVPAKLRTLLAAMLNYGAAAQVQFKYKTDNLANAILQTYVDAGQLDASNLTMTWSDDYLTDLVEPDAAKTANFASTGTISCSSKTLVLQGAISIKTYMNVGKDADKAFANAQDVKFYFWNNATYNSGVLTKDNAYVVEPDSFTKYNDGTWEFIGFSDGIFAMDYDDTVFFAICVTDANGVEHCSGINTYSPEAYAARQLSKSSTAATLKTLIQWMVVYGEAAKAYFG